MKEQRGITLMLPGAWRAKLVAHLLTAVGTQVQHPTHWQNGAAGV